MLWSTETVKQFLDVNHRLVTLDEFVAFWRKTRENHPVERISESPVFFHCREVLGDDVLIHRNMQRHARDILHISLANVDLNKCFWEFLLCMSCYVEGTWAIDQRDMVVAVCLMLEMLHNYHNLPLPGVCFDMQELRLVCSRCPMFVKPSLQTEVSYLQFIIHDEDMCFTSSDLLSPSTSPLTQSPREE